MKRLLVLLPLCLLLTGCVTGSIEKRSTDWYEPVHPTQLMNTPPNMDQVPTYQPSVRGEVAPPPEQQGGKKHESVTTIRYSDSRAFWSGVKEAGGNALDFLSSGNLPAVIGSMAGGGGILAGLGTILGMTKAKKNRDKLREQHKQELQAKDQAHAQAMSAHAQGVVTALAATKPAA